MEIPRDVWLYLGQFISDDDLRRLISLNSAFLELGLNARYRDIRLHFLEERTIRYLVRLMDPAVAKRIRFFSLEPLIAKTFDQDKSKPTTTSDSQDKQGRPSLWKKGVDVLRKHVGISKKPGDQDESVGQYPPTLAGLEQALVDAVSCWSNLREFSAKWWDAPELQQLEGFLHPAWSTFGPSLRKVTLAGSPASIRTLLFSAERLPSLCVLRLELTNSVFLRVDNTPDVTALEDTIAPFINSVSPTLEVLSISSWGASIDLSQFFLKLGVFPRLRRFNARVPFNKAFANTPDGLTRLLHDHSHNLTSVGLRLNPTGAMIDPSQGISLRRWMESINSDPVILSNLTTLEMYPGSSGPLELISLAAGESWPPPLLRVFLDLLKRSADTLTELAVRDRYLSYEEVESVLSTFASRPAPQRLTVLCLNVRALSLRLLDLLSRELPYLRKLSLYATREDWIDHNAEHDGENSGDLRTALRDGVYADWKLQEIGIWVSGSELDRDIMQRFVRSIPSLRDFRGLEDL